MCVCDSLLRHGDRGHIANQAQLVNIIAPIRSEEDGAAWRQSTFWPCERMARLARGQILRLAVSSSQISTKRYGDVDACAATTRCMCDRRKR